MPAEYFFSQEIIAEISRRYLAGEPVEEIVGDFGIHRVTFYKWIRRWGVPYRKPNLAHQGRKRKVIVNGKRECARCKEWKEIAQFSTNNHISDKLETHCKSCQKIVNDKNRGIRFGITRKEYDELLTLQKGVC